MADNLKNAILKKKISDTVYELMIKTMTNMVYDTDGTTTLATILTNVKKDVADNKTKLATLLGEDAAGSLTTQIEDAITAALQDSGSIGSKIKTINDTLTNIQKDAAGGILFDSKAYTDSKIGNLGSTATTVVAYVEGVKAALEASITGAFHFKGTKDYQSELPSTSEATQGDVYQVRYKGTSGQVKWDAEFAFDGTAWVEMGSFVDLSSYATTESVGTLIDAKAAELLGTDADAATVATIKGALKAAANALAKANEVLGEATDTSDKITVYGVKKFAQEQAAAATKAATDLVGTEDDTDASDTIKGAKKYADKVAQEKATAAANGVNTTLTTHTSNGAIHGRFIVQKGQPADLTEYDLWADLVDET